MTATPIAPGAYRVNAGGAGVYLIDAEDGVTVVDAGMPGRLDKIMSGIRSIGRMPTDVNNIMVTHYHPDHVGSLGELAEAVRAKVWAPQGDVHIIRDGGSPPELQHRGVTGKVMARFARSQEQPPKRVDHEVEGGEEAAVAGGMIVVDTAGHTGGHVSYLWPYQGGVLFAGDAAANVLGKLDVMPLCEDFATAERSFASLAELDFNAAGFGHGRPLVSSAGEAFRRAARKYAADAGT